jgi:type II secretory pathway pseudopilin PulG
VITPAPAQVHVEQPQPTPPNYQPNYQHWPPPSGNLKQGLAITSLVIGCVNFVTLGLLGLGAITGLTFGIIALSKAKKRPSVYGGQPLAIAGVATNGFWLLIVFPMVMAVAIPNLLAARKAANESAATYSLRSIGEAEMTYARTRRKFGSLSDLAADNLIESDLADGLHYGYRFQLKSTNPSAVSFEATAVPANEFSGSRSFLIDETGVMRASDIRGQEVSRYSRPLDDNRSFRSYND